MSDTNENGPRLTSRPVGAVSEETSLLHAEKYTLTQGDQQGGAAVNREDIIRMAREAGLSNEIGAFGYPYLPELERFAALVAAAEREACAKVCETEGSVDDLPEHYAAAIRKRGEVKP